MPDPRCDQIYRIGAILRKICIPLRTQSGTGFPSKSGAAFVTVSCVLCPACRRKQTFRLHDPPDLTAASRRRRGLRPCSAQPAASAADPSCTGSITQMINQLPSVRIDMLPPYFSAT